MEHGPAVAVGDSLDQFLKNVLCLILSQMLAFRH